MTFYPHARFLISGLFLAVITACGGGGGSSSSADTNTPTNTTPVAQDYLSRNVAANAISFSIQKIPGGGNVNTPYVSVEVCQPGTSTCQTISNLLLDTGSTGLRIFSSSLGSLQLPNQTQNNSSLIECASFISGVTWGPVKLADVKISAETARSIPIQVIADPLYFTVPT